MTRSEKIALSDAFDIPEPEKKRQFITKYEQLAKKQKRKLISPLFIKIASMAAACAVVCGVWFNVRKNTDIHPGDNDHGNISIVVTDTEEENTPDDNDSYVAVTTVSAATGSASGSSKTTTKTALKTTALSTSSATQKINGNPDVSGTHKSDSNDGNSSTSNTSASKPQENSNNNNNNNNNNNTTTAQQQNTKPTDQPEPPQPQEPVDPVTVVSGEDKTITPSVVYNDRYPVTPEQLRGEKSGSSNGVDGPGGTDGAWHSPVTDNYLELAANQSDSIISGTIDNILYTSENGVPYTQLDITVNSILKSDGSVVQGDKISVRYEGGYISADEYARIYGIDGDFPDDWIVYERGMGRYLPSRNQQYIFFIRNGGYNIPQGGFSLVHETDNSILTQNGDTCTTLDNNYSCDISSLIY